MINLFYNPHHKNVSVAQKMLYLKILQTQTMIQADN